jgi:hypothetical protein
MKKHYFLAVCLCCASLPTQAMAIDWMQQATGVLGQLQQPQGATQQSRGSDLSQNEMVKGLKEALTVGTGRVVSQLSRQNGFLKDRSIHIPLPNQLAQVRSTLAQFGMSGALDDLETKINRAAEHATPQAKALFLQSIRKMSLRDAQGILRGPNDAATRYFERNMTPDLRKTLRPLIEKSLNQVGAVRAYDAVMADYRNIPMMPDLKGDLNKHAIDGTLKGVFHYLAQEEAAIRQNPAKQTTRLLQRVFAR